MARVSHRQSLTGHPHASGTRYRADIDGLRALAVIPVILFHAKVAGFGGGFVGVDIFFVISGYLITQLIFKELQEGRFSFMRFWERRARRILPALIVVILFCILAGWFILIPEDFVNFGKSVFAQSVFASNVLFWREAGYFDAAAETKPLLHTWSLAIEEQFYLIFPGLAFLLFKFARRWLMWVLAAGFFFSLALSAVTVQTHPSMAFYLLPMRAWELTTGAMLALAPTAFHPRRASFVREAAGWLGLGAIAFAVFAYDATTPFPGLAALAPCLGTAAIIWSNQDRLTSLGRLLSTRPLVQTGLMSYSLYLWHWPLIAFAHYLMFHPLTGLEQAVVIAASFVLAALSWKFVETPIRERRFFANRRQIMATSAAALAMVGGIGLSSLVANGYPARLPPEALAYAAGLNDMNPRREQCHSSVAKFTGLHLCRLGNTAPDAAPVLFVWGDSHASAVMPVLDLLAAAHDVPAWYASSAGCPPVLNIHSNNSFAAGCTSFNDAALDFARHHKVKHVLLIGSWTLYTEGREDGDVSWRISDGARPSRTAHEARAVFARRFRETVETLKADGFTVWIMEQVPAQPFTVPRRLAHIARFGGDATVAGRPVAEYRAQQAFMAELFASLAGESVRVIDPADYLCDSKGLCHASWGGRSLYRDDNHLSRFGSLKLRPMFEPMFEAIAPD